MTTTIYAAPDCHQITVRCSLPVATKADSTYASLPIGTAGMEALGVAPLAFAAQHGDAADRTGAALAHDLLKELLALHGRPEADAHRAVCDKPKTFRKLGDGAAAGFATVIVDVLATSVTKMPKLEVAE